jgi:hypothetical protein
MTSPCGRLRLKTKNSGFKVEYGFREYSCSINVAERDRFYKAAKEAKSHVECILQYSGSTAENRKIISP